MPSFQNDPVDSQTDSTSPAISAVNSNTTPQAGVGVHAKSAAAGVLGESTTWHGVAGITQSTTGGAGVFGAGDAGGPGVIGTSKAWIGVFGETFGTQNGPAGVWADGHEGGSGVKGHTSCPGAFGVAGFHLTNQGPGIFGQGSPAGLFKGDVEVTGDLILTGADYAEAMSTTDPEVGMGNVVVLGDDGEVHPCDRDYDTAVAGIVSGAGGVKAAIVLDRHEDSAHVAMMGKVWCLADADAAPIRPGDLLTTSSTIGHCRRVTEPGRAFGAVIGKALTPLASGRGLVRVLVGSR